MSLKFSSMLFAVAVVFVGASSTVLSQVATQEKSGSSRSSSSDDRIDDPITAKAVSKLIKEKKFDQATKMLDAGIAQAGPDGDKNWQQLRNDLAKGLGRARKFQPAYVQGEKYIRSLLKQDGDAGLASATTSLSTVLRYGNRCEKTDSGFKLAMDVLAKADKVTDNNPTLFISVMRFLVPICVSQAQRHGDEELSNKILTEKLAALDALKVEESQQINFLIAKTKLLQSRVALPNSTTAAAKKLKEFIVEANAAHPDSIPLLQAYMRAETFMIGEMLNNYPQEAKNRVAALSELVGKRKSVSPVLRSLPGTLRSFDLLADDALKLLELVGTKAPKFEAETWINGSEQSIESLKGKVVLVDFWAVWCIPCIASFPHLQELNEEFKDDGLAIVGVTKRYNYRWDDQTKKASHVDDEVPAEEEFKDTEKFVKYHKLQYPVMITPEKGTMLDNYRAFAFPHVVIIDREGTIQLARVGAGRGAFEQIHAKVKELLEKK